MKRIIVALLVLTACGTAVFAGEMKKEGSLELGYSMPGGDMGDLFEGGVAFGFEYEGYKINDLFSVGGAFIYTGGKGKSDATVLGVSNVDLSDFDYTIWGLTPYVKAAKEMDLGGTKANVYGSFGLGFYGSSVEVLGVTTTGSDIGFNLGGGIMFPLGDKMQLGADIRYHSVDSDSFFIPGAKFTYSF